MKTPLLTLLLSLLIASPNLARAQATPAAAPAAAPSHFEPAKHAAWWQEGETVVYQLTGAKLPDDVTAIEGIVTNVSGKEVDRVTTDRKEVEATGWSWKPKAPGFYEVTFSTLNAQSEKKSLARSFTMKSPTKAVCTFDRTKQGLAVVARHAPVPDKAIGQFGFGCYETNSEELLLSRLIGFDLVRLTVPWGAMFTNLKAAIEPVKGEFHWEKMDAAMDLFDKAGFVINAQFLYTPLWASPYPEKLNVNICNVEGTVYAPKDMHDFENFVELTVSRYKDRVHLWEIWNEPSVPGGSVFWADTTENFLKMLEVGYTTVKKVQPDAEVWLGGLGPRAPYHTFYNKLLSMGGGKYFDVLSLHGSFNSPVDKFRAIETAQGVAPKPAVQGEWHAVLQGSMRTQADPILSEEALSLKMMKDLLYQLKGGVSRIFFFELQNQVEKETLDFCGQNKWFTHSSGLFRRKPQLEPRQPAVVLTNFLNLTGRKASCVKEFKLSDTAVALELSTGQGPLVVFWSEESSPTLQQIKAFTTKRSTLRDWEGKTISLSAANELERNKLYYLSAPNSKATGSAETVDKLISPNALKRAAQKVPQATYLNGKLFETVQSAATVPDAAWIKTDWILTHVSKSKPDPLFAARAAVGVYDEGLDVVVEVQDAVHSQNETPALCWNGDSVQIAFDCEGNGISGGNTEILSALTPSGPVTWKVIAADPKGDIPQQWSPATSPAKYVAQTITREGNLTRYQMRFPWSELYPMAYDATKPLRLSFVVNNNDGAGRSEYLEWGTGIVKDKDPSLYGRLNALKTK